MKRRECRLRKRKGETNGEYQDRKAVASGSIPPPCPEHKQDLSYVASFVDAARRRYRGERQVQCDLCFRWYWPKLRKPDAET